MLGLKRKITLSMNSSDSLFALLTGLLCGFYTKGDFAPFACSAVICFYISGFGPEAAFVGALAALFAKGAYTCLLPLCLCFVLCLIWILWQGERVKLIDKILILAVCELSQLAFHHGSSNDCKLVVVNCITSILICLAMSGGVSTFFTIKNKKRCIGETEAVSVGAFCAVVCFLLSEYKTAYGTPASIMLGVICMVGSQLCKAAGLYIPILCATGAWAGTGDVSFVGLCAVACVLCSCARRWGKYCVAGVYALVCGAFGIAFFKSMTVVELIITASLFLLIPQSFFSKLDAAFYEKTGDSAAFKKRIDAISKAARGMKAALSVSSMNGDGYLAIRHINAISTLLDEAENTPQFKNYRVKVETGMACIPKEGCAYTGDSVLVTENDRLYIIAVSDGMGSGLLAHNESSAATRAFTEMLLAGFSVADCVDCVNRRLLAAKISDFYATLDALVIDRANATVTLVKMGSPPVVMVRDGKAKTVCSEALPLGIVETVVPFVKTCQLKDGDTLVVLTDGASDAMGSGLLAEIVDNTSDCSDMSNLANRLLDIASADGVKDDMSIVCTRISL